MFIENCRLEDALYYAQNETAKLDLERIKQTKVYMNMFEYYLMGTYPPLKAMKPISVEEVFENASEVYNLYIHIPFCKQLCTFCHFAKEINAKDSRITNYLNALHKEIDLITQVLNHKAKIKTIFFGGGTPSILTATQIEKLFTHINQAFNVDKSAEITFELHPGLIREKDYEERIQTLIACGVNRWVSGVQAMDDKILKKLNRGHNVEEVYQLLEILNRNGVDNLSLDLMYGLPYQTLENWYDSIKSLLQAGVSKYNIFPLMFKMSDPVTLHYMKQPHIFPSEDDRFLMHFIAEYMYLSHGFNSGPIFYYSKSATHSQQQKSKFEEIEEINLLPLGVSSFGYIGHTQYNNYLDMNEYLSAVNNNQLPIYMGSSLGIEERMRRNIMFALRSDGIHVPNYIKKFGKHPADYFIEQFKLLTDLQFIKEEEDYIKLTRRGSVFTEGISLLFVSDAVRARVKITNAKEKNTLRRSQLDKYDFSPIERIDYHEAKNYYAHNKVSTTNLKEVVE